MSEPTEQNAPLGYEKLIEARIAGSISPEQVANEGVTVFEFDPQDGSLRPVAADHWRSKFATLMWKIGYKRHYYASDLSEEERRAYDESAGSIFRNEPTTEYSNGPAIPYSYPVPRLLVVKKDVGISKRQQHRPKGTGLEGADKPLLDQMRKLMDEKQISATAAAWDVIGPDGKGAAGNGTPESKVTRLVRRLKAASGE